MRGWIEWARESFGPPMAGILFWCGAGLLVVMSAATASNSVLRDLVTGFGSMAQVAIAFLVWRISSEQLKFTKRFNERQLRIMEFPQKSKMFDDYKLIEQRMFPRTVSDEDVDAMINFSMRMRTTFSDKARRKVLAFAEATENLLAFQEEYMQLTDDNGVGGESYRLKRRDLRKAWRGAKGDAHSAIYTELILDPTSSPD